MARGETEASMVRGEWSPQLRTLAGVGGAALALYAFGRMGLLRAALVGAGALLVARAATNLEVARLVDVVTERLTGIGSRLEQARANPRGRRAAREEPA